MTYEAVDKSTDITRQSETNVYRLLLLLVARQLLMPAVAIRGHTKSYDGGYVAYGRTGVRAYGPMSQTCCCYVALNIRCWYSVALLLKPTLHVRGLS